MVLEHSYPILLNIGLKQKVQIGSIVSAIAAAFSLQCICPQHSWGKFCHDRYMLELDLY